MNYKKSKMLYRNWINLILIFAVMGTCSCAGKSGTQTVYNKNKESYWKKELGKPLPSLNAWGEVSVDVKDTKYRTEFALKTDRESLIIQFLDPVGGVWWELKSRNKEITVKTDGKIETGEGSKFLKRQLGIPLTIEDLKSIISGRPTIEKEEELVYKKGILKGKKLKILVKKNRIKKWIKPRYEVVLSDFRKIGNKEYAHKILIKRKRGKGEIKITYEPLNIVDS